MGDEENQRPTQSYRANIPIPTKLDIQPRNLEVAWRKFKRQWTNYEVASRLDREESKYRCSVLLACIGDEAFDVYEGLSFTDAEDRDDIEVLLQKFEEFYVGETNEIYETFVVFNRRNQGDHETIDAYVTALRKLAKTCNFGDEERMLFVCLFHCLTSS